MTDLPPKAEVHPRGCYVAFVPTPDSCSGDNFAASRLQTRKKYRWNKDFLPHRRPETAAAIFLSIAVFV
jgi:hypothetical protein